jgi:aspartokinase
LYNEYLNLSSFALYILPRVEQMTKKEVTIWSIKIALSRISKEKQKSIPYKRICSDNIFVKKNISLISLNNTINSNKLISKLHSINLWEDKNYFWVIQWVNEIDIIYSKNLKSWIDDILCNHNIKLKIDNLWAIWIHLDEELLNTMWVIYNLTKKLAFYNINIVNILSTYTEIVFVIKEKDIKKAFEVLMT